MKTNKQHIVIFWQKNVIFRKNTSWFWRKSRSYLSQSRETSIWIIWDLLMHLSESRVRKKKSYFTSYKQQEFLLLLNLYLVFTKLILHHIRAVTAASRASTIADLTLGTTRQPEPYILWSRYTHTLPSLTLISTGWALICATAPTVRSPAKSFRHLEWVRNSCYCIEVLPRGKWQYEIIYSYIALSFRISLT